MTPAHHRRARTQRPPSTATSWELLALVRHGETDDNACRRFQGHRETPLNEKGRKQARLAALFIQHLFSPLPNGRQLTPASVLSSDLIRVRETVCIISESLERAKLTLPACTELTALREFHMGKLEGFTWEQFQKSEKEVAQRYLRQFQEDPLNTAYPGPDGESPAQVRGRLRQVLQDHLPALMTTPAASPGHPQNPEPPPWHDRDAYRGTPCHLWIAHGGVIHILLELLLGSAPKGFRAGNADTILLALPRSKHSAEKTQAFPTPHFLTHHRVSSRL